MTSSSAKPKSSRPQSREVEVTVLEGGLSRNGWLYSPELLSGSVPLFEGARAFADHPGPADRAERSIRDVVGYYHSPRFRGGAGGQPARINATPRCSRAPAGCGR